MQIFIKKNSDVSSCLKDLYENKVKVQRLTSRGEVLRHIFLKRRIWENQVVMPSSIKKILTLRIYSRYNSKQEKNKNQQANIF